LRVKRVHLASRLSIEVESIREEEKKEKKQKKERAKKKCKLRLLRVYQSPPSSFYSPRAVFASFVFLFLLRRNASAAAPFEQRLGRRRRRRSVGGEQGHPRQPAVLGGRAAVAARAHARRRQRGDQPRL
jgi:hypothetical protein